MPTVNILLTLSSVGLICIGQILFKLVGLRLHEGGQWLEPRIAFVASAAMAIYGVATVLWIYVLRTTPLSKAYPYMALSFLIVPVASVLLFSEQLRLQYLVGAALIVFGVILTQLSSGGAP